MKRKRNVLREKIEAGKLGKLRSRGRAMVICERGVVDWRCEGEVDIFMVLLSGFGLRGA
jgi:hypothetical protein